ncbi:MAG: NFACT family protein [Candidatus Woesearchaeota archaeon]
MSWEITSLDLHYLVKELSVLENARVEKIFQSDSNKRDFLFIFHKSKTGKFLLRIMLPSMLFFAKQKPDFPAQPPGYCMFLRKHLTDARITKIEQHTFERILEFTFSSKEQEYALIIELFSTGNIILCNSDHKIISPLENQNWKDRTIRGGIKYEYPPKKTNTKEVSFDEFYELLTSAKKSAVKTLATAFSLGGAYAEELCFISGIDKKSEKLNRQDAEALFKNLKLLFEKNEKAAAIEQSAFPFSLKTAGQEKKAEEFNTFSEALQHISCFYEESKADSPQQVVNEKKQDIAKNQEAKIREFEIRATECQRAGELLYEHYSEVDSILSRIQELKKKKSWNEIKEELKKNPLFNSLDEKAMELVLDIEEK